MEDLRRSKHVNYRYHHVRENVKAQVKKIQKVATSEMISDLLTKPISSAKLRKTLEYIGMVRYNGEGAC